MKKNILSVKELEIPIAFHNYKLLQDKSFILKGSNIYFIQGSNGIGKTSFLKALESAQIAKDDTASKVTVGQDEGFYEFNLPSATGETVTIRHEFTDTNSKFIAIREDGTKISNVTDIRKLFNYTPLDVKEFFALSEYAEGRRKQRDIILKLLPDDLREEFNQLDLQEQHYYNERTKINSEFNTYKNIASVQATDEEKIMVDKEPEALKLIDKYQNMMISFNTIELKEGIMQSLHQDIKDYDAEILKLQEASKKASDNLIKIQDEIKILKDQTENRTVQEVTERISKGKDIISKISDIKARIKLGSENLEKSEKLSKLSVQYDYEVERARKAKQEIIENSELPVNNITFEDGYLKIDGFLFKENQICESDAVLLLANILARINPAPVQIIGDASILDNEKLEKLNEIAEKNNKIMFVDEVIRDSSEMVVVGYEEIRKDELNTKLDKVEKKTRKSKTPEIDKISIKFETDGHTGIGDDPDSLGIGLTGSAGPIEDTKNELLF
jgi:recombinational DNA repair ATPase RecF